MDKKKSQVQLPSDLTTLSDEQLAKLQEDATAEFDEQIDSTDGDPDARLARATELADILDATRAESTRRVELAAERDAAAQSLRDRVHPQTEPEGEPETDPVAEPAEPAAPAPVAVVAAAPLGQVKPGGVVERLMTGQTIRTADRKLNPSLADIQRNAPAVSGPRPRREQVLVASAEIPGVAQGSRLGDMDALVAAMTARARSLPVTARGLEAPWYPVASLQMDPRFTLDLRATPEEVNEVLTAATDVDALVAAGGWCAPSEISYDFYNIVCEDGLLDLPTVGVNRGGIRFPTSASYGDIVNNFWAWNETQDIAAATGTAQSGTKTCFRVPCPSFNEVRLHCDGLCVTVGNLMEDAFPELIANHMKLTNAGFAHRLNTLKINTLIDPTVSVAITGYGVAGSGLVAPVLGALELCAIDYREKYRMCDGAVLEVILPRWLRGAMRADLRKRQGMDWEVIAVTDAMLMNLFDILGIRVQWVTDWQIGTAGFPGGSTPVTLWPTSIQFLMYAAGTFVLGTGLQLNLGVVRDSVLNQTNDHTGAWMEQCWLIAKLGHESRLGTIAICADGTTGAADLTACGV